MLGTSVADALVARDALTPGLDTGPCAVAVLGEVAVDLEPLRAASRPLTRACTDWTERRPHLAGGLGAAVAGVLLDRAWVVRRPGSRGLDVTADGAAGLEQWLGLRLLDVEGWRASA